MSGTTIMEVGPARAETRPAPGQPLTEQELTMDDTADATTLGRLMLDGLASGQMDRRIAIWALVDSIRALDDARVLAGLSLRNLLDALSAFAEQKASADTVLHAASRLDARDALTPFARMAVTLSCAPILALDARLGNHG